MGTLNLSHQGPSCSLSWLILVKTEFRIWCRLLASHNGRSSGARRGASERWLPFLPPILFSQQPISSSLQIRDPLLEKWVWSSVLITVRGTSRALDSSHGLRFWTRLSCLLVL